MDRRRALKNIGLGAGFLVATPTVLSILKSCASEPDFIPVFVTPAQGHALKHMVDLIMPADETVPGAVDVGAHKFIDSYWQLVTPTKQDMALVEVRGSYQLLQDHVKLLWGAFEEEFKATYQKELADGTAEDFDGLLANYLRKNKQERTALGDSMGDFLEAYDSDSSLKPDQEAAVFSLLTGIRGMTIWAWKSSEQIGKNVLWYDPIPGQQIGCIPISEAGNGNVMSL